MSIARIAAAALVALSLSPLSALAQSPDADGMDKARQERHDQVKERMADKKAEAGNRREEYRDKIQEKRAEHRDNVQERKVEHREKVQERKADAQEKRAEHRERVNHAMKNN